MSEQGQDQYHAVGVGCPVCAGSNEFPFPRDKGLPVSLWGKEACPECARVTDLLDRAVQPYLDVVTAAVKFCDRLANEKYTKPTIAKLDPLFRAVRRLQIATVQPPPLPPPDAAGGGACERFRKFHDTPGVPLGVMTPEELERRAEEIRSIDPTALDNAPPAAPGQARGEGGE